jgi:hypothetical protein
LPPELVEEAASQVPLLVTLGDVFEGFPNRTFGALRSFLVLIGIGASASLTACVFEDGWRGGHEGGHERHWR